MLRQFDESSLRRGERFSVLLLLCTIAWISLLVGSPGTDRADARTFKTGFGDPIYLQADQAGRDLWLDRSVDSGASVVRLIANWARIAPSEPANPRNPADPAYDFSQLDAAVIGSTKRGISPMIMVYRTPVWAEAQKPPPWAKEFEQAWRPSLRKYSSFAKALTERYSGDFQGLPRVKFWEPWNEPNLPYFLSPQWSKGKAGGRPIGAEVYRGLLNAFYDAAHAVKDDNVVVGPATAPYGGKGRSRPAAFLRQLLCLTERRKKLVRAACPVKAKLDRLSHHPITTSGGSGASALHPDDVSTPDMTRLIRILRAAERRKTILPRGRRQVWATELWWSTNPPNYDFGVSPATQARWIQDSFFRLWKAGVSAAFYYLISDRAYVPDTWDAKWAGTGIYFDGGAAKPAQRATRFPFVARATKPRGLTLWTRTPSSGVLIFERKARGSWKSVSSRKVVKGAIVNRRVKMPAGRGKLKLRARMGTGRAGGESSLVWVLKRKP